MGDGFKFPFRFVRRFERRRRMGIVTLVLALLFVIGWMRSLVTRDVFYIRSLNPVLYVASVDGAMSLEKSSPIISKGQSDSTSTHGVKDELHKYWDPWEIRWNWRSEWCGFLFGSGLLTLSPEKVPPDERRWVIDNPPKDRRVEVWMIPYWSITIPLTLLSTLMLILKPRKSTPEKTNEPCSVEGA